MTLRSACIAVFLIAFVSLFAAGGAAFASLKPTAIHFQTGKVTQEEREDLYLLGLMPQFQFRSLYAVLGVNLYFDNEFRLRDEGNDVVVLDSAGYRRRNFRVHYGDIQGLTLGRGFIVRNYYSNTMSNVPDNEQKGIIVDRWTEQAGLAAFWTLSHLKGIRGERRLGKFEVGSTIVSDTDPEFKVVGLDASYKPIPPVEVYAEAAQIEHYGSGSAIGLMSEPFGGARVMVEYRRFDADFVPGIVDEHYEARPAFDTIAGNPTGRIDGYFAQLSLFEDTKFPAKLSYEDYEATDPRLTFGLRIDALENVRFNLYYAQENFVPSQIITGENSVLKAQMTLDLSRRLTLIFDYYCAFDDSKEPLESLDVHVRAKL